MAGSGRDRRRRRSRPRRRRRRAAPRHESFSGCTNTSRLARAGVGYLSQREVLGEAHALKEPSAAAAQSARSARPADAGARPRAKKLGNPGTRERFFEGRRVVGDGVQRQPHPIERHSARALGLDRARDLDALACLAGHAASCTCSSSDAPRARVAKRCAAAAERPGLGARPRLRDCTRRRAQRGGRPLVAGHDGRAEPRRRRASAATRASSRPSRDRYVEEEEWHAGKSCGGRRFDLARAVSSTRARSASTSAASSRSTASAITARSLPMGTSRPVQTARCPRGAARRAFARSQRRPGCRATGVKRPRSAVHCRRCTVRATTPRSRRPLGGTTSRRPAPARQPPASRSSVSRTGPKRAPAATVASRARSSQGSHGARYEASGGGGSAGEQARAARSRCGVGCDQHAPLAAGSPRTVHLPLGPWVSRHSTPASRARTPMRMVWRLPRRRRSSRRSHTHVSVGLCNKDVGELIGGRSEFSLTSKRRAPRAAAHAAAARMGGIPGTDRPLPCAACNDG